MNILFLCTSNKDRSPALQQYFSTNYPAHQFRSAGLNRYWCGQKGTNYLAQEAIEWAQLIVFAEEIHHQIFLRDFNQLPGRSREKYPLGYIYDLEQCKDVPAGELTKAVKSCIPYAVLEAGHYEQEQMEDYVTVAEYKIQHLLSDAGT